MEVLEKCRGREGVGVLEKKLSGGVGRRAIGKKCFEGVVEVWGGGGGI